MKLASSPPAQGPCFAGQTPKKGLPVSHHPCLAHPQTANARGKVAENATLPLCQPAAAVRQTPEFDAAPQRDFCSIGSEEQVNSVPTMKHVATTGFDEQGQKILLICGQEYRQHPTDVYMDDALRLVQQWDDAQVTFGRVVHLRNYLRENYGHGHEINFQNLLSLADCKSWIDEVIKAEYRLVLHEDWAKDQQKADLEANARIMSSQTAGVESR